MAQYREKYHLARQVSLAIQTSPRSLYSNREEECDIARNKICDIIGLASIFRKNKMEKAPGTKSSPFKLVAGDRNVCDPGARFSKAPIINGPVKLLLFTRKVEVSIVLHLT